MLRKCVCRAHDGWQGNGTQALIAPRPPNIDINESREALLSKVAPRSRTPVPKFQGTSFPKFRHDGGGGGGNLFRALAVPCSPKFRREVQRWSNAHTLRTTVLARSSWISATPARVSSVIFRVAKFSGPYTRVCDSRIIAPGFALSRELIYARLKIKRKVALWTLSLDIDVWCNPRNEVVGSGLYNYKLPPLLIPSIFLI